MSWHGRRGEQTHGRDPVMVEGDVQPTVDVEAGGEDLGAVAPHTACSPLPVCCRGTGATPEGVSMNAVLIVPKVSLRVVTNPEGAEDAVLASSPGAQRVRGERGQQRVGWQGRQGRLQEYEEHISFYGSNH